MYFLLKVGIFHCYVSLPGGNFDFESYIAPRSVLMGETSVTQTSEEVILNVKYA